MNKQRSLEADGQVWVYDMDTGEEVAAYEGIEVHEAMLRLKKLEKALPKIYKTAGSAYQKQDAGIGDVSQEIFEIMEEVTAALGKAENND